VSAANHPALQLRVSDALLVVDLQRDFLPGGALAVDEGDRVIAPLNDCLDAFVAAGRPVFASRDWHPPDHVSFHAQGGPWPPHCVAGTPGAAFAPALHLPREATVISKAQPRDREAYSVFAGTVLAQQLRRAGLRRLFVGGLATDYCVLRTVLDARWLGFDVVVLRDAIAAVDAEPGDGERAIAEMQRAGALLIDSRELVVAALGMATHPPVGPAGSPATGPPAGS
jgi:nicotinamidase/pyrazinamidase